MFSAALCVIVPMLVAASGLILLLRAGKVSSSHLCLHCGYDLRGLPTTDRCPECGTKLNGENTVIPGQFRTRQWRVAVGSLLLFFGGIGVFIGMFFMMVLMMADGG